MPQQLASPGPQLSPAPGPPPAQLGGMTITSIDPHVFGHPGSPHSHAMPPAHVTQSPVPSHCALPSAPQGVRAGLGRSAHSPSLHTASMQAPCAGGQSSAGSTQLSVPPPLLLLAPLLVASLLLAVSLLLVVAPLLPPDPLPPLPTSWSPGKSRTFGLQPETREVATMSANVLMYGIIRDRVHPRRC